MAGCLNSDEDDGNNGNAGNNQLGGDGALVGRVQSLENGAGVADVSVTINGQTVQANEQGWFAVPNLAATDRALVQISAPGYATTQRVVAIRGGRSTFVDARLFERAQPQSVEASTGGEFQFGNARINLPAGALQTGDGQAFSGTAQLRVTTIDPSTTEARMATPGNFTGVTDSGQTSPIESFGMIEVNVTDGQGDPLQVDGGVQIAIPAAEALGEGATDRPQEVPLWRYDADQGRWVQGGTATYDATSDCYVTTTSGDGAGAGSTGGSTYWNADMAYETACLSGRVVTPDGEPAIGGIQVTAEGVGYIGDQTVWTEEGGRFEVDVMASTTRQVGAEVFAQGGGLYTETPTVVSQTPTQLSSEGCTDIGDIVLAYPLARMVLTWGENPSDLDSHFTGPLASGEGSFHVDYTNMTVDGQALLDTDDTSSFGPEVTSVIDDVAGTYVYAIHNYSGEGSGPIAESGANIQAFMPGEIRSFDVADATNNATTDDTVWRVFSFEIGSGGDFSNIRPINEIVDNGEGAYVP